LSPRFARYQPERDFGFANVICTYGWQMMERGLAAERQRLGRKGEELARRLLRAHGYVIEAVNVRRPVGELDVVAWEGETLCFIEVRSTRSDAWGGALATINGRKRRRLLRAAQWYLSRRRTAPREVRFDVVAIDWQPPSPRCELIRNAFSADEVSGAWL
jgi:putative endonuclease